MQMQQCNYTEFKPIYDLKGDKTSPHALCSDILVVQRCGALFTKDSIAL